MSSLETRARQAAEAINEAVTDFSPAAPIPLLRKRQAAWRGAGYSAVAAGFAMLIALVTWWTVPTPNPEVAEVLESSTTTLAATTTTAVEPSPPC